MSEKRLRPLYTAFSILTVIPLGPCEERSSELSRSATAFPLVGAVVGSVSTAAYFGGLWLVSPLAGAVFALVAEAILTGAMHLDGLCDTFDGIGARGDAQRTLEVMRDSRVGATGAAAVSLHLLLKCVALAGVPVAIVPVALVTAGAVSRWCAVWCMYAYRYARPSGGLGKPFSRAIPSSGLLVALGLCCVCIAGSAACMVAIGVASAVAVNAIAFGGAIFGALTGAGFARWVGEKIGGMTGDVYGAVIEVSSSAAVLGVAAIANILSPVAR